MMWMEMVSIKKGIKEMINYQKAKLIRMIRNF